MTPDIHSLVGAYALDAVDDLERAAFDRHVRECEACRAEADELRETASRLTDGTWSVPPPRLRENVLAEISTVRQLAPAGSAPDPAPAVAARRSRRVWLAAAVAAMIAGGGVYAVQDQRVRDERAAAEAAQASEARVRSILAAPDLVVREQPLNSGGRVTVATSRLRDAGVIMLAADGAPGANRVYQLWAIRGETPASVGALGVGESAAVRIVEGLPSASGVGVTIEAAPSAATPTTPLDASVTLT